MSLLSLQGVSKRFGASTALDALSLDVGEGEFLALLGGSGSGKSTLLRVVAGFERPDSGRVLLRGADITALPPQRRDVAMMFQSYALFPHMSVFENIAYGLRRMGEAPGPRVAELVEMLGLAGLEGRRPHQLSGGQQQRVALARALARRPTLVLLDEPLAALDANLRERTGFELRAIQRRTGSAFVMVTHDQAEALSLADRVAVLDAGRIAQVAPPRELYERPATREVARFLGAANLLDGPGGGFALRPERIRIAPGGRPARVEEVAFRGADVLVLARLEGGMALRLLLPAAARAPAPGEAVELHWEADDLVPLAA
ncbi:ABC transporter ATP-binding protein [Sabulicella rubraurantiaca]|uniref:ABC transporter ATP-binding protein n=1 Tax=Sabulicella rubraurantiaca TaxID=2811429 RepID=UPI001A956EC8|nr:ABC transporter ATP-binding protein [Sabulicella rubraurantiaca]